MKLRLQQDARPQAMTLLVAAALSVLLWFIPYAEILTYPFRIFVTFIHEGGHALAALLTGNSVESLRVAINASGETNTTQGGLFSQIFIASSGYVGAMAFGALLLVLIRRAFAARMPSAEYIEIADAGHEVLMERNIYRAQFWKAFDVFTKKHRAPE